MGNQSYKKLLAGFFIMMLLLTVLSRAADSVTVPRVETATLKQGTLAYRASADGKIIASDQEYIRPEKGAFIKKVLVGEGQRVEKGDVLFTLDLEQAQEQLLQAETELAELTLSLKKAELDSGGSASDRAAVENAKMALVRAKADSDFNAELNGGKQMLDDKRAVEDAEAALKSAEKQLEENRLRSDIDRQLLRLKIREQEQSVKKTRTICAGGGTLVAESSGTVGSLSAEAGTETTGEPVCTLVPDDADYICEAELPDEDAKYMKIGDPISVLLEGKKVPVPDLVIRSLQSSGGKTKITAAIPAGAGVTHGMAASINHSSVSKPYANVVPLSALRGSEGNYHILVVQEADTVLGRRLTAVRVDVTVQAMDNKLAALDNTVDGRVIQNSSKPVEEGDRVREVSNEN